MMFNDLYLYTLFCAIIGPFEQSSILAGFVEPLSKSLVIQFITVFAIALELIT